MRWHHLGFRILAAYLHLPYTAAEEYLRSTSLTTCQDDSLITASLFDVTFFPANDTVYYNIHANASITGNVSMTLQVIAYGYYLQPIEVDPCNGSYLKTNFCPIETAGDPIDLEASNTVPANIVSKIPSAAYAIPDLDGKVRILIDSTNRNTTAACLETALTNGKTVYQKAIGWTLAAIAGLALTASAVASGLGFSNTSAHVAANALSLFAFFQAQAMYGMTAVTMPPIVEAWTQNFQWSMGIIHVGVLQRMSTWYQQSTGGTPSRLLDNLSVQSINLQKRSLDLVGRSLHKLSARGESTTSTGNIILKGILRVGFKAQIEPTNIFMTGLIFLAAFFIITLLLVLLFKFYLTFAVKMGWMHSQKFQDFRTGSTSVVRGIIFRLILIGYPQMTVLCLWELTRRDSAAEVALAILMILSMTGVLVWTSLSVFQLARKSIKTHQNPGYILYSNPKILHTWGFLYVSYRSTAYYWVFPTLLYIFVKGAFIGLAQSSSLTQAIGLLFVEIAALIASSILRPWMDRRTNAFNIAIFAVHFVNAVFLLMFTSVFDQPAIVNSVMGIVFVLYNAIFALVLLIMVLVSAIYALFSKNPDLRYAPASHDSRTPTLRAGAPPNKLDVNNRQLGADSDATRGDGEDKFRL